MDPRLHHSFPRSLDSSCHGHQRLAINLVYLHVQPCIHTSTIMINAVLVFNNAGQPRLTKFYTQLVRPHSP